MNTPNPTEPPLNEQPPPAGDKPGTNEVQHEPDPNAEPIPDGDPTYHPRSPYTVGNY